MGSDPWFRKAIELAACEHVFKWPRERQISVHCTTVPNERSLCEFLSYFQVARTVCRKDRPLFLEVVSENLRKHLAESPDTRPDFSETPEFLLSVERSMGRKPLSALSKWVLVTNQGSAWTPFDWHVCAALRISGDTATKYKNCYATLNRAGWESICRTIDKASGLKRGFSIARVFDKFLFLAGSERQKHGAWRAFLGHANALCDPQRQHARELADAILASPEAVALLTKRLVCNEAREALEQAYDGHVRAPRSGGGA